MVYRRTIRCVASGESSTGTRTRFQIGVLLGGEENSTKKQMQAIIDFETKLAKITIPPEERRDEEKLYNLMSLNDLQRKAPFVRLLSPTRSRMFSRIFVFQLSADATNNCGYCNIYLGHLPVITFLYDIM